MNILTSINAFANGDHKLRQLMSNLAPSLRLEPAGRVSPERGRRGGSVIGGGGCHVPARPYVPASLDHLRVEGHDLRDAQGRTGT